MLGHTRPNQQRLQLFGLELTALNYSSCRNYYVGGYINKKKNLKTKLRSRLDRFTGLFDFTYYHWRGTVVVVDVVVVVVVVTVVVVVVVLHLGEPVHYGVLLVPLLLRVGRLFAETVVKLLQELEALPRHRATAVGAEERVDEHAGGGETSGGGGGHRGRRRRRRRGDFGRRSHGSVVLGRQSQHSAGGCGHMCGRRATPRREPFRAGLSPREWCSRGGARVTTLSRKGTQAVFCKTRRKGWKEESCLTVSYVSPPFSKHM